MLIPLIIIQVITFVALVLLLRMLFQRHLSTAVNRLNVLHEQNLVQEEELKQELDRGRAERISEIEKGKLEAQRIVENAKKEAASLKIKLGDEAKIESKRVIQYAEQEAEKFKQNISVEMSNRALDLSLQMIKYTLSSQGKENLHHQFIDEVITEIKTLSKDKFTVTSSNVKIIAAFALSEAERQNLITILSDKLNTGVSLEEHLDPELVTGLVLEIGPLIINGSLKNKLSKAAAFLKNDRSWF